MEGREYYLFQEASDALGLLAWLERFKAMLPFSADYFYVWGLPLMNEKEGQIVLDCGVKEGNYIKFFDILQYSDALGISELWPYETFNGFDRFFIVISVEALEKFREGEGNFLGNVRVTDISFEVQKETTLALH